MLPGGPISLAFLGPRPDGRVAFLTGFLNLLLRHGLLSSLDLHKSILAFLLALSDLFFLVTKYFHP